MIHHEADRLKNYLAIFTVALSLFGCGAGAGDTPPGSGVREVTLLYTNDFESAYDPIPAFWRDDLEYVGGITQLTTLIDQERERAG